MPNAAHFLEEHLELYHTNFTTIFVQLYELCRFYTLPKNKLPYLKKVDNQTLTYKDFVSNQTYKIPHANFDCLQFAWFILKKSAEYGYITSNLRYKPTTYSLQVIAEAISRGYLIELHKLTQLKQNQAGIFFFLESPEGMTTLGQRHIGFYFVHNDGTVSFISNRRTKGGVVEDRFKSREEFLNHFKLLPKLYISS